MKPTPFVKIAVAALLVLSTPRLGRAQEGFEAAEILYTQAVLAYDDGNYREATSLLRRARELDPGHMGVVYYLGLSLIAEGNHNEAERHLREGLAREPKNSDLRFALGVALYNENKYDDALKEFLAIYQTEPQKENLGYYIGLCYYRKENYESAATYFRRNVSSDPKIRQANQYSLGLALRAMGREGEAIEELTEAVKIAPAGPLVGASQQLLTTLREDTGRKRLSIAVTVNAQYDTNPGFLRDPTRGSPGHLFFANVNYTAYRSGPWESTLNYYFLNTINYDTNGDGHSNHKYDIHDHGVAANVFYKSLVAGLPTVAGFQLANDFVLQGGDPYLHRPTGTFTFTVQENASNATTLLARAQYKYYLFQNVNPDEDRRATNHLLGFIHCMGSCNTARFAQGQFQITLGYNWDRDDARGDNWDYTGHKGIGGFSVGLPWEVQLAANFEVHYRFYPGRNSTYATVNGIGRRRRDLEILALAVLSKDLTSNLTASFQYFWNRDISSIEAFNARRQVFALGLTWHY